MAHETATPDENDPLWDSWGHTPSPIPWVMSASNRHLRLQLHRNGLTPWSSARICRARRFPADHEARRRRHGRGLQGQTDQLQSRCRPQDPLSARRQQSQARQRLQREAQVMVELDHPNIVKAFAYDKRRLPLLRHGVRVGPEHAEMADAARPAPGRRRRAHHAGLREGARPTPILEHGPSRRQAGQHPDHAEGVVKIADLGMVKTTRRGHVADADRPRGRHAVVHAAGTGDDRPVPVRHWFRRCAPSCACASRTPTSAPNRKPSWKPTCRRWGCCEASHDVHTRA